MALSYNDWNFADKFVDPAAVNGGSSNIGGNFISSESLLVCAGPPLLGNIMTDCIPIGIVQNFNVSQNKNIQQLFEIGSRETILLPGRTFIQSSISRILFGGPSLLKALYRGFTDPVAAESLSAEAQQLLRSNNNWEADESGDGKLYINLAGNLFNAPIGLALLMHDNNDDVYGGAYLENTLVASHSMGIAAGQTILAENVSLRVSRIKPIKFSIGAPS